MSEYESERLQELHNKGQEDDSYDPPHSVVDDLLTWRPSSVEKVHEENEAYNKGWKNDRKQSD